MRELIELTDVTKDYHEEKGIFNFSFSIKQGEVFGLVGTNGSGKTTTMRNMMGFIKPNNGAIKLNDLDAWSNAKETKKLIGYVPGEVDFPDVGTGLSFLKMQAGFFKMKDLTYMNYLIDLFKLDVDAPLKRMSKGMKQKTALVAAFMSQPDILLLDEPSTGLDPMMRDVLITLINEQKNKGKTVFLSSHIFKELEDTCDRVAFIEDGKFIEIVDRNQYDEKMYKQYKVGFKTKAEYDKFLKYHFNIIATNVNYLHLTILINDLNMNDLFKSLSAFDVRYINYEPYTLEWYYTNIIKNKEAI